MVGTIPSEIARLKKSDGSPLLTPWGCAVWAEASGEIRGGGILVRSEFVGPMWTTEYVGLSGYANGQHWTGDEYKGVRIDPLSVVRRIWNHLQGQPGGDLGLDVDQTSSPVRIGTDPVDVEFTTDDGEDVSFESGPFKMNAWSTADVGKVIDDLAASTPFDYLTRTQWDGDQLSHRLELSYPRRGSRRDDMRFVVGENVLVEPTHVMDGDEYATEVLVLGSGEGSGMVRANATSPDRRGLRRAIGITDKSARSKRAATDIAKRELAWRNTDIVVEDIQVIQSALAEVHAIRPGDEVFFQSDVGWLDVSMWVRVLSVSIFPEDLSTVVLRVARSETVVT